MVDWTQGAEGAAGGAATGATVGSAFGPWGTAIGGIGGGLLGGLGGLFGGSGNSQQDQAHNMLQDYYNKILGRGAPQAGAASQSGYSSFRQNQGNLINHLEALSNGQGPSLAMAQLQAATDKNLASTQAMAASGRGGPIANAQAMNQMGRTQAQASQDSVGARIQEEQMALGMLGSNINAGRQSDESTNQFNASQQNEMQRANLEARLRSMGMDDNAILQITSQMFGQSQAPQLGDKLLAGGMSMLGNKLGNMGRQGPSGGDGGGFGSYQRNPDGSTGPITSPSQLGY